MPAMTYLELVNRAIFESKITTDSLTAATFPDPPRTFMYMHMKNWINAAYEELFQRRPNWFFRKERAVITIRPRLFLGEVVLPIVVGDVLTGQTSTMEFTVMGTNTVEESEGNAATELTVSVEYPEGTNPNEFVVGESLVNTSAVVVGKLLGLGRYDFTELVPGLQEIDPSTVYIANPDDTLHLRSANNVLAYIDDPNKFPKLPSVGGRPLYITQTSQGSFQLFPQPREPSVANFDYIRKIPQMVLYNDVPEALPDNFHMYLVWRAVLEYADFDNNPVLFRRAKKHIDDYIFWLERDELVNLGFEQSRFNR